MAPPSVEQFRSFAITGESEPFLVTAKVLKSLGREELDGVSGGMAERFQHARRDKNGNLVRFKTEKPSRLQRVETGRNYPLTQKFSLSLKCVHIRPFFHESTTHRCVKYTEDWSYE